ncbi:MAG: type IX secretion system sortase PorU [Saprospiraceae bacterium]
MKYCLTLFLILGAFALRAQTIQTQTFQLNWDAQTQRLETASGNQLEVYAFESCSRSDLDPTLPLFTTRIPLDGPARIQVQLQDEQYSALSANQTLQNSTLIQETVVIDARLEQERNRYFARIKLFPIRKNGSSFEKLERFSLAVETQPIPTPALDRNGPNTYTSVLSNGSIYKFGVENSGIYKLDYNFLKNELGISDLDNIDPRTIRLYGNGGAMLPELVNAPRHDDLVENAIQVVGEDDGVFNSGDYILFYALGPKPVFYNPSSSATELNVQQNLYEDHAWYFIKTGGGSGARIASRADIQASYTTDEFDDVQRIEDEKVNLLDFFISAQGSGKRWFGDYFLQTRQRSYEFDFPNAVAGSTARARLEFAGRCATSTSIRLNIGDNQFSRNISGVSITNNESNFAASGIINANFQPESDKITAVVNYPEVSQSSEGWLDYLELNVRRKLIMSGNSMTFRDLESLNHPETRFRISGVNGNLDIWDITYPYAAVQQESTGSGSVQFGVETDTLRTFIAFYPQQDFPKPETVVGNIPNQNIHGLDDLDMVILYHPDFESAVEQLADHRRSFSGLDVATVRIDQLYNEFSSGGKDPSAIRDFARMMYDRAPNKFEFLLLFGDGSFDPKNNSGSQDNIDFIPVFETYESYHPIYAYPSDDYFGLLSDGEGSALDGALDIAVGRITSRTPAEAQAVVNKILDYDNQAKTLGDWHLRLLYIADDEDSNAHINQAEKLAAVSKNAEDWFNLEKIYFDAYQQVATIGDDRYPDANAAINSNIFKGALISQYIGHGGPRGWAQERVIDNNDIAQWNNENRYPLIITATCSFGGYDDYKTLTGGEQALLKVQSGAVALFTTVRAVYIDGNNKLTDAVQSVIFDRQNGWYRTIGDILKDGKNTLSGGTEDNARRFTLLGDPAMYLALPEYRVETTSINGNPSGSAQQDTIQALMPVEIEGQVTDTLGNLLSDFNGKVYVSLFDKEQQLQTLGQDPGSIVRTFGLQRNILFKGSATVTNGKFKVNFIVPRDINYTYGFGKISYYAENGTHLDAAGADETIVIGGNANAIQDDQPPLVQAFLNTDAFVSGGITDNSPNILIKCSDDNGMNVTGVSLGHDLTVILDDNQQEEIVLNDFYESEQDNSKVGQAVYPLRNLAPGRHTLRAKGWDIANNSGEGYTEFIVAEDGASALTHVLNYPNPFSTNTYFQFEHNLAGQLLDVQISIFSVSGKLVKTILHTTTDNGFRVDDIAWDGRDEYGDQLARGVYLYRIKVRGASLEGNTTTVESDFEKLVILK